MDDLLAELEAHVREQLLNSDQVRVSLLVSPLPELQACEREPADADVPSEGSLAVGARVQALWAGSWYDGRVHRLLGVDGAQVEVLWDEGTVSTVERAHVRAQSGAAVA